MKTTHTLRTTSPQLSAPKLIGDVGYDLLASYDAWLTPGRMASIPTDVRVQIPMGFWGLVIARSWANAGGRFIVLPGVIDAGYRGELFVYVWYIADKHNSQEIVKVEKGEAFAQLILIPACVFPVECIDDLDKSERESRGFGSTGVCKSIGN
ncbi:MAG: dUTP diphosphatase [Candidatus Eisenbacteria sp.]|nr:dUTP diphosphatase [Candidatus Eisenbacteria bacterium]